MSDGGFSRLGDSERQLGPQSVLLCGFSREQAESFRELLRHNCFNSHQVIMATEPMVSGGTVLQALTALEGGEPVPPEKLPRVALLSGFQGHEIKQILDDFSSTGIPRPIFAVATPSNLNFSLKQLLLDLLAEHRAMAEKSAAKNRKSK